MKNDTLIKQFYSNKIAFFFLKQKKETSTKMNFEQNSNLNNGFIGFADTISDTHVNQFYLESSYDCSIEQIRLNSECMENFLDESEYDIQCDSNFNSVFYEQSSSAAASSSSVNSSNSSQQSLASSNETDLNKKSIMINCKNLCTHLVKPLTSKLVKKFTKNSKNNKQNDIKKPIDQIVHNSKSTQKVQYLNLKTVQNLQDIIYTPALSNSSPTNQFNNFGDFVLYNI